jgi:hypothetical protein
MRIPPGTPLPHLSGILKDLQVPDKVSPHKTKYLIRLIR